MQIFRIAILNKVDRMILTVPHAYCEASNERMCDELSLKAATLIYSFVNNDKYLLVGDKPRYKLDLNRKESREGKFRKTLTKLMKTKGKLILDIHSFPPKYDKNEIYLLSLQEITSHALKLKTFLRNNKIKTGTYIGDKANDIILEATYLKIPNILIEFREDLSKSRLRFITSKISEFYRLKFSFS